MPCGRGVAQPGQERLLWEQEVGGSNPLTPTTGYLIALGTKSHSVSDMRKRPPITIGGRFYPLFSGTLQLRQQDQRFDLAGHPLFNFERRGGVVGVGIERAHDVAVVGKAKTVDEPLG